MTEHLPECLVPDFDKGRWICICNQLRACEQRVAAGTEAAMMNSVGYQEAFTAVRKAVAALPEYALIGTALMVISLIVLAWTR